MHTRVSLCAFSTCVDPNKCPTVRTQSLSPPRPTTTSLRLTHLPPLTPAPMPLFSIPVTLSFQEGDVKESHGV